MSFSITCSEFCRCSASTLLSKAPVTTSTSQTPLLTCQGKGVAATGYDTPQGFVVKAGSFASSEEAPSLKDYFPNLTRIRSDLVTRGVLVSEGNKFRFTQDYTFNSPSQASSVVFANSSNGRVDWKDSNGRIWKQLQKEGAGQPDFRRMVKLCGQLTCRRIFQAQRDCVPEPRVASPRTRATEMDIRQPHRGCAIRVRTGGHNPRRGLMRIRFIYPG